MYYWLTLHTDLSHVCVIMIIYHGPLWDCASTCFSVIAQSYSLKKRWTTTEVPNPTSLVRYIEKLSYLNLNEAARTDLVLIDDSTLSIIELTIPFNSKEALQAARLRKCSKQSYLQLVAEVEDKGYTMQYHTLEIGSLGHLNLTKLHSLPDGLSSLTDDILKSAWETQIDVKRIPPKSHASGVSGTPQRVISSFTLKGAGVIF